MSKSRSTRLKSKVEHLKQLVKAAYLEGWTQGYGGRQEMSETAKEIRLDDWEASRSQALLDIPEGATVELRREA